jgi:hypothetical protein
LDGIQLNFEDPTFDCHTHPGEIIIPRRKRIAAPDSSQDADIFRALEGIDPQDVRAIILGQDALLLQRNLQWAILDPLSSSV